MHGPNVEPSHEIALASIASGITVLEAEVGLIEEEDAESTVEWIGALINRLLACQRKAEEIEEAGR